MGFAPNFLGEGEVPNQVDNTKSRIHAHESRGDGKIWLVYQRSNAQIFLQIYDPDIATWTSPVRVDPPSGIPLPQASTLVFTMDSGGGGHFMWGTVSGTGSGLYHRLVYPDGVTMDAASLVTTQNSVGIRNSPQALVAGDQGDVHAAFEDLIGDEVRLADYGGLTRNWTNERVLYDGSGDSITAIQNIDLDYCNDDGSLHAIWSETTAALAAKLAYHKEGGAKEVVSTSSATITSLQGQLAVNPLDSDEVRVVYKRSVDPTGSRIITQLRTLAGGWSAESDESANGDNGSDPNITVDPENNVHIVYHDEQDAGAGQTEVSYERSIGFTAAFSQRTRISTLSGISVIPYIAHPWTENQEDLYIFWADSNTGNQNVYWNRCNNCVFLAEKRFGSAIEVIQDGVISGIDHFKMFMAQTDVWGGGPVSRSGTSPSAVGRVLFLDTNHRINADGELKHWAFAHNQGAPGVTPINTVFLVILRDDGGGGYDVIGVEGNSTAIPDGPGVYGFTCSIPVLRNDYVAISLPPSGGVSAISGVQTPNAPDNSLLKWYNLAGIPAVDDNFASPDALDDTIMALAAWGALGTPAQIQKGLVSDETGEVASEAYLSFTLNIDAFADANVTTPENLFDTDVGSSASIAAGDIGNVYYNVEHQPDGLLTAIQWAELQWIDPLPTGTFFIELAVSEDEVTVSLAGAQGIPDGNWKSLAVLGSSFAAQSQTNAHLFSIGRRARWVRLRLTNTEGVTALKPANFEIAALTADIDDGEFTPNPGSKKDRFWVDSRAHRHAGQITFPTAEAITASSKILTFASGTPDEFFEQFEPGDRIWVVIGGRTGTDAMKSSTVASVSKTNKTIRVNTAFGEAFVAGATVQPPMLAFRLQAIDAGGVILGTSPWIPLTGTIEPYFRNHTMFTGDT